MKINRNALRAEAKKIYKQQVKGVPKKFRVPFATFFKQYREQKLKKQAEPEPEIESVNDDFDFENIININEINDDDIEILDIEEHKE